MTYFITESGNQDLLGKKFMMPDGVRRHLKATLDGYTGSKTIEGYKRLNNLLGMTQGIDYNELKRLKNFFDNYPGSPESDVFTLNGGLPMKNWVNATLSAATQASSAVRQAKRDLGMKSPSAQGCTSKPGQVTTSRAAADSHKAVQTNRTFKSEVSECSRTRRMVVLTDAQATNLANRVDEIIK